MASQATHFLAEAVEGCRATDGDGMDSVFPTGQEVVVASVNHREEKCLDAPRASS